MATLDSPIPLSELESVLAWVDTFKLSRQTKKINRDFSDAVLLAEILAVHYPKLVEMHNYPPRNGHALKLNNWMTLNRKVLKKLRLNLCCNTMEQLANCAPGVIERVLIMVRDKIRRDEELNKSVRDAEQNVSSGGSYYEACGDEEHILVVPVKTRVNGVLETIQQKVVRLDAYHALKEELKDAKDAAEVLKQKVEHLDDLMKLKDERIDELQKQLERKQARRKETEAYQNSLAVPFEAVQPPILQEILPVSKKSSQKIIEITPKASKEESRIPIAKTESMTLKTISKHSVIEIVEVPEKADENNLVAVQSDVFVDVKTPDEEANDQIVVKNIEKDDRNDVMKNGEVETNAYSQDADEFEDSNQEEFKDSSQDVITTIGATIQNEIKEIIAPNIDIVDTNHILKKAN